MAGLFVGLLWSDGGSWSCEWLRSILSGGVFALSHPHPSLSISYPCIWPGTTFTLHCDDCTNTLSYLH